MPDPTSLQRPGAPRGHGAPVPGADQAQELLLGMKRFRRKSLQGSAQIPLEWLPLADREDPRLLSGMGDHGGHVPRGEDSRM